ncbi:ribosomal protein S18 acetylase RimI-like enzyme [Streptomyces sp. Amel2xB2]|uniref:GNAT family N-acetyltransferase n=1 Tax=Streptomyces sp. Amel2xB2 TaxID=1305829 RepID=UPI000DBAA5F4|nr:GNAT family N-acetyltransferase [Streptomyces sp. Amel2xB2]RAJ69988.1 ribosomal protein S18 acetylase RimI-like enzyme [Streptomyces sp. Amel2xB2]
MIELRVLTPDDWRSWRALRLAALADAPYAFKSPLSDWQGPGDREERWRDRLSVPGACDLLALLDGEPVGMAGGTPGAAPGEAWLRSLWVGASGRGRGVADRLLYAVEEWAAGAGADVLRLSVIPGNTHAIALYRRHGFADTGRLGDLLPDGRHEVVMAKRLDGTPSRTG